ncbi:DUF1471 domain-containing protein [Salmonella enterica subsp. enterica serovar Saintpaul]|nr:DUF1471 domain-containing protein [Salmonella enterica subsp. enterica serovar Saintpaul]EBX0752875.1 DUF1471 domain-containing protein [Salmonella enterica subsp. enterica serovar Saintpaul]ECB0581368.1 DUF1471 domain-containing protein [Salmonella enterica subsp. enterica serovar Saintpaul]ECI6579427.1 DUF1471 domain-containing protein [Salmonella enterica subsp. enterica serovar Saintpaul]
MKNVLTVTSAVLFSLISFAGQANTVSVTADTLENAEAKIAKQAAQNNSVYHITEANTNNRVHMTAELIQK